MLVTLSLSSLLLCVAATILFYVGIIGKQPQSLQKKAICCLAVSFLLLSLLLCVNFIRDMISQVKLTPVDNVLRF